MSGGTGPDRVNRRHWRFAANRKNPPRRTARVQGARRGEGATKLVTVIVTGGASTADARKAAKAIANSPLVKTAIHGGDPNWGRLIAVAGRAGVSFELSRAKVAIGPIVLFEDGRPYDEAAPQAAEYLKGKDLTVSVDLGAGDAAS